MNRRSFMIGSVAFPAMGVGLAFATIPADRLAKYRGKPFIMLEIDIRRKALADIPDSRIVETWETETSYVVIMTDYAATMTGISPLVAPMRAAYVADRIVMLETGKIVKERNPS